ncbi:MAG: ATP-binding protein, partial [Synergistaceae bacterium]|nr:ATP-binding protein [Synergistaceae bacterium]
MIPGKETLTVEFKSDMQKIQDSEIFEAVVAFANTDGGDIYLGVENDGRMTGVHETHRNPVTLSAYIANNTVPPISVRTEVLKGEKPVLKISVPKSHGGIAATASGKILRRRIKLDGMPENIPMYPTELSTRLSSLRLLDYSAMPVSDASIDDFDPLETERLRKIILAYEGDRLLLELQDKDLYKALGFTREIEGRPVPTMAGLLMIGRENSIETHIPTHSVSFQVLEGSSVKMNEDISLPLLAVFEKLSTYMDARNPEHELEIGMFRMS